MSLERKHICLVAILKEEDPFLDEWIRYHRLLGIDHFFLYDDDPRFLLTDLLKPHCEYITIINWHGKDRLVNGKSNQAKAYTHALNNYIKAFEWVAFIDGDEFIVLPGWNDNIHSFLYDFTDVTAISLNWHVFGHNGFFDDPEGLITCELNRRMKDPSPMVKTITRTSTIWGIESVHYCYVINSRRVDANHRPWSENVYDGITAKAYINHYQCRSFKRWMARVNRGDASATTKPPTDAQLWRHDPLLCLKQFVTTVAYNKNEIVDNYMLKFKNQLSDAIVM